MTDHEYQLGTVDASERLILDLYIDLRRRIHKWSSLTKQTAQARMGYVGQHLVSVATGFPGGKSGGRGDDLKMPGGRVGEIKTCYRVDQLGCCSKCKSVASPTETQCSVCGSEDLIRKDDSKWLITFRDDHEFEQALDPAAYFLVLFEFQEVKKGGDIVASIWSVDPRVPGFALCMVDYYYNIRAKSASKAPFNLWPHMLKFHLMRPLLIYRSHIRADDRIETVLFPNQEPVLHVLPPLVALGRSTGLSGDNLLDLARRLGIGSPNSGLAIKKDLLKAIDAHRAAGHIDEALLTDLLARVQYLPLVQPHLPKLPSALQGPVAQAVGDWTQRPAP